MPTNIITPADGLTQLPNGSLATVAPDACLGIGYFGRDNAYCTVNRRQDMRGPKLVTYGAPVIDPNAGVVVSSGNRWDTGIREEATMTWMVVAQISETVVSGATNQPFLMGTGKDGSLDGLNLVRTLSPIGWQAYCDYDVSGSPNHVDTALVSAGATNTVISCLIATFSPTGHALYDMTRPEQFEEEEPPVGASGRWVTGRSISIGANPTAPFRGPHRLFAWGIWGVVLDAGQRAALYAQTKAVLAEVGVVI